MSCMVQNLMSFTFFLGHFPRPASAPHLPSLDTCFTKPRGRNSNRLHQGQRSNADTSGRSLGCPQRAPQKLMHRSLSSREPQGALGRRSRCTLGPRGPGCALYLSSHNCSSFLTLESHQEVKRFLVLKESATLTQHILFSRGWPSVH